uniref:Uncharacterized protein n=1 Tax=Methylophaga nitratireducenticrescens TaxID=754476 RepID=I1XJL5_METNJ
MLFVTVSHGDKIKQVSKWDPKFINLKENPINHYDLLGLVDKTDPGEFSS